MHLVEEEELDLGVDFDVTLFQRMWDVNLDGLDGDGLEDTAFLVPSGGDEPGRGGIVAAKLAEGSREVGF